MTLPVLMMSDGELDRRLHEQAPLPKNPQDPIPKTLVYQVGELRRIAKITCYEAMQRDQPMAIRLAGAGLVMPRRLLHSGGEDGEPVEVVVRWASGRPARPLNARAGEDAGEVEA